MDILTTWENHKREQKEREEAEKNNIIYYFSIIIQTSFIYDILLNTNRPDFKNITATNLVELLNDERMKVKFMEEIYDVGTHFGLYNEKDDNGLKRARIYSTIYAENQMILENMYSVLDEEATIFRKVNNLEYMRIHKEYLVSSYNSFVDLYNNLNTFSFRSVSLDKIKIINKIRAELFFYLCRNEIIQLFKITESLR